MEHIFAVANAMTADVKTCSRCRLPKIASKDFYLCQGKWRSECKACTIKKNVRYQKRVKAWKHRYIDNDEQRSYMIDYYAKNKEKFAAYRKKFKEKYPEYYKEYSRKRKDEKT